VTPTDQDDLYAVSSMTAYGDRLHKIGREYFVEVTSRPRLPYITIFAVDGRVAVVIARR